VTLADYWLISFPKNAKKGMEMMIDDQANKLGLALATRTRVVDCAGTGFAGFRYAGS
jgi:hypothetical protein